MLGPSNLASPHAMLVPGLLSYHSLLSSVRLLDIVSHCLGTLHAQLLVPGVDGGDLTHAGPQRKEDTDHHTRCRL